LGVAPAMAAYRLRKDNEANKDLLSDVSPVLVENAINTAVNSMITSNKSVAQIMQKIPIHAATDITGFGLKGHLENMAMLSKVNLIINNLYVIQGTPVLSEQLGYPLLTGEAKETAGGILLAVSKENADDLQSEFEKYKIKYCPVGYVAAGKGEVNILKDTKVTETETLDKRNLFDVTV
ncbi:MAG: hypothetical protein LBE70_04775, partial [Nitrososphaerota archaeon]|nr:hypothetical protein [Nitrososphaerota archaeon]